MEPSSAVTFFVVALFLGLLAYHVLSFVPVPYTAMLLVRDVFLVYQLFITAEWVNPPVPVLFSKCLNQEH